MLRMTPLTDSIRAAWTRETSMYPDEWSVDNPSWGQSDISAAIIHLSCGGRVKMGLSRPKYKHFWNNLEDNPRLILCDIPDDTKFEISRFVPIKAILCDLETKKRFFLLKMGILDAGFPLAVDDSEYIE